MLSNGLQRLIFVSSSLVALFGLSSHTYGFNTLSDAITAADALVTTPLGTDTASTIYHNPAGLTRLKGIQVTPANFGYLGIQRFSGTTSLVPPLSPTPYTQIATSTSKFLSAGLSFYFGMPLEFACHKFAFGFAMFPVFGYAIYNWPTDSILRFTGTKAQTGIFDVANSFAYQATDKLSLGIGIDLEYLLSEGDAMSRVFGGHPEQKISNYATAIRPGWHMGVTYEARPNLHLGFNYQSPVFFRARGTSTYIIPGSPTSAQWESKHYKFRFVQPGSVGLAAGYDVNPCWTVNVGGSLSLWNRLHGITAYNVALPFDLGVTEFTQPIRNINSLNYGIATHNKLSDQWLIRAGITRLEPNTDTHDPKQLNVAKPLYQLGVGGRFTLSKVYSVDFATAFVSPMTQVTVDYHTPTLTQVGHGSYQLFAIGGQLNVNL